MRAHAHASECVMRARVTAARARARATPPAPRAVRPGADDYAPEPQLRATYPSRISESGSSIRVAYPSRVSVPRARPSHGFARMTAVSKRGPYYCWRAREREPITGSIIGQNHYRVLSPSIIGRNYCRVLPIYGNCRIAGIAVLPIAVLRDYCVGLLCCRFRPLPRVAPRTCHEESLLGGRLTRGGLPV